MANLAYLLLLLYFTSIHGSTVIRTADEIKDYAEFLKNTVDGKPSPPVTPELEELQNEWERSGKFEGDILLTDEQRDALVAEYAGSRNALISTRRLWPDGIVYYSIATSHFTEEQIEAIHAGINEIERVSCIKFVERTNQRSYVIVAGRDDGCYAIVGYVGVVQYINLSPNTPGIGCFRHGTIIHEFLHTLGFYHMHSTYDRDDWVRIIWEKIQTGSEHNFIKYTDSQVSNLGEDYDYGSCMHYSEYGFSVDGSKTIEAIRDTEGIVIGQRIEMSKSDINRLNRLYNCPGY